jgi:hypothetical protein
LDVRELRFQLNGLLEREKLFVARDSQWADCTVFGAMLVAAQKSLRMDLSMSAVKHRTIACFWLTATAP